MPASTAPPAHAEAPAGAQTLSDRGASFVRYDWVLWLAGGVLLCTGLWVAPVNRTQEARVLETAREMLGSERHNWLVPRVNGHIRLQKPPLAYWLTAETYKLLGVSEGAGRLPAALAGWLTVGVTASLASWLFGRRAGFFAGAALLGSYLFFRHSRLAETDVLATLFVMAAVYALWRGYGRHAPGIIDPEPPFLPSALWFHAGAVAIALAVISKGPPAAYPLIFLVAMAGFDRRWKMVGRFFASGAPVTLALIALPWFLYIRHDPDYTQLVHDLKNSAGGGRGHSSLFITYIPPLFVGTAPWSVLWLVALIAAARNWRRDPRLRGLVILVASMLLPLSLWGNKQFHYLMPVMPPLMVLVGWLLDESLKPGASPVTRRLWIGTAVVFGLAGPGLIIAGKMDRGFIRAEDIALGIALPAALAAGRVLYRRRGPEVALPGFVVGAAVAMFLLSGLWAPTLDPVNSRSVSRELLSRYGDGPYAFLGKEDLPIVFHMRRIIPTARSDAEVTSLAARQPPVVAIEPISGTNKPRQTLVEEARFVADDTTWRIGRLHRPAPGSATTPAPPNTSADPDIGE